MKVLGEGEKRLTNGFGILEDLEDIPIDEIMAIGLACSAAAGTAILMIEAFNRLNESTDERIRKAEVKMQLAQVQLDTQLEILNALTPMIKELMVVGSILPDKVG